MVFREALTLTSTPSLFFQVILTQKSLMLPYSRKRTRKEFYVPWYETGMKTNSNQEPFRSKHQPLLDAGNELTPKEPAAQKPQLPSIGKVKLEGRAQHPRSLHRWGPRQQRHSQARTALGRWLRRWLGHLGSGKLRVWGCAVGP